MDKQKLITSTYEGYSFNEYLGIEVTEMADGNAKGAMTIRPEYENLIHSLHGGCIFSLADTIGGAAAISTGGKMTTLTANINFMAPAISEPVIYAEARTIKRGKTITIVEVIVKNKTGKHLAKGDFTFFKLADL